MSDNKIRLATTDPSLKDKINVDLKGDLDKVFWYIKFNIPLDEATVVSKNMNVTDIDGYIMRTEIDYDDSKNTIVLSPLDSYAENIYYLLNISRKVKSAKGKPLKKEINILFKLKNNQISQYELLKSTVTPPKPVPRPKDYESLIAKKYSLPNMESRVSKNTLDFMYIDVNIIFCVLGLLAALASLYINNIIFMSFAVVACIAGFSHVLIQFSKPRARSAALYNFGVMRFNKEKYQKAQIYFHKACKADPNNEEAEYALNKVKFYL